MRVTNPGRAAGLLYLALAVLGAFSLLYVPSKLIVPDNPSATASNILASEMLYRLSIVSGLMSAVVFIFLARALYRLFHEVSRAHASLMVTLVMISVAIGFALTVNDIAALMVLRAADLLSVFTQSQREALALLFLRLGGEGVLVAQIFWGLWLFPFGVLVVRSGFLPSILGVLLIINGAAYIVSSLTGLLLPAYADLVNRVTLIPMLGEIWIMLWLLIKGATVRIPAPAAG
jgi:Domain of unknown function (DUF4386)